MTISHLNHLETVSPSYMRRMNISNAEIIASKLLTPKAVKAPKDCHKNPAITLVGNAAIPVNALNVPIAIPRCPSGTISAT